MSRGALENILSGNRGAEQTQESMALNGGIMFPCIDWVAQRGCSMLCPHCHPQTGAKPTYPLKAYYALHGETKDSLFLTLLTPEQASSLAKMLAKGEAHSGTHIQFVDTKARVVRVVDTDKVDTAVDHAAICRYMATGAITFLHPQTTFVFRSGPRFCGLGLVQYHAGVSRTPVETQVMTGGFEPSVIAALENEREQRG